MLTREQAALARGRVESQLRYFLRTAEQRFQRVPEHLAAQARVASPDQLDARFDRLRKASIWSRCQRERWLDVTAATGAELLVTTRNGLLR